MYPKLRNLPSHRDTVDVFLGYNHNLRNNKAQFYEMQNMTSEFFPVLSPRKHRGTYKVVENPQGLIAKTALVYIDGTKVVVDGVEVEMGLSTAPEDCPKDLTGMGAYVIIMPDRKYINAMNIADRGDIDASFDTTGTVTFEPCDITGKVYDCAVQTIAPDSPEEGTLWIDTSESVHQLKKYTVVTKMWVVIATTYIKISATGIGKNFKRGDGVRITGVTATGLTDLNASMVIQEKQDDWIVVIGLADGKVTQEDPLSVTRKMPKMDFLTESNNRLWGCRFGSDNYGEIVNQIYACKLGDFKNWEVYEGTAADSYYVNVGSDGPFTGCVTQRNLPVFYKEACKHKIYGGSPKSFGLVSVNCQGVGLGNYKSVAIVNEMVYYLGTTAVCVDDGTTPREISDDFGTLLYHNGVGGASGSKYFLSCQGADGKWNAFVYDSEKGMWHREDDTHALAIETYRDNVYYIDAEDKTIHTMYGSGDGKEKDFEWSVETGLIGTDSPDHKYISRVDIRMMLDVGTRVFLFVQYDSIGQWEAIGNIAGDTLRSFDFPVRIARCDHFRLKIVGRGDAKIFSITKRIGEGY